VTQPIDNAHACSVARWAKAAAALATTGFGAVDPLPQNAQVQQLLLAAES